MTYWELCFEHGDKYGSIKSDILILSTLTMLKVKSIHNEIFLKKFPYQKTNLLASWNRSRVQILRTTSGWKIFPFIVACGLYASL